MVQYKSQTIKKKCRKQDMRLGTYMFCYYIFKQISAITNYIQLIVNIICLIILYSLVT